MASLQHHHHHHTTYLCFKHPQDLNGCKAEEGCTQIPEKVATTQLEDHVQEESTKQPGASEDNEENGERDTGMSEKNTATKCHPPEFMLVVGMKENEKIKSLYRFFFPTQLSTQGQ